MSSKVIAVRRADAAVQPLFITAIALSAFLLFLVQPIIAKQLLPWFGGSSAVWVLCLVFFQVTLLGGYAYAHVLTRRLTPQTLAHTHLALLLASLICLPIVPSAAFKPDPGTDPTPRLLVALLATVGLPYFLLSTTSPLLQSWIAPRVAKDRVYRLFALSNFGSLLGLLAFPFAIEPFLDSERQAAAWSVGYALFVAAVAGLCLHVRGSCQRSENRVAPAEEPAPGVAARLTWLVLAALGSIALLGTSAHLTQNIASVPFLWVLPLALYLLSFVIAFDGRGGRGWYDRRWGLPAMLTAVALMAAGLSAAQGALHISVAVPLYCIGLLAVTLFCHGELAASKPAASHLTDFYLSIASGGAFGGLFVGLIAPHLFRAYFELPAALVIVAIAGALRVWRSRRRRLIALVGTVAACYFSLLYAATLSGSTVHMQRNFYGVLRIQQERIGDLAVRRLVHGVIAHGAQAIGESPPAPRTYFTASSGAARAIVAAQQAGPVDVGVIGLGVGTLASYARPGDRFRFYELDGDVLRLARSHFSYLAHSGGTIEFVLGDARLSMEREAGTAAQGSFDVLVLDAFSSDAIPLHLLTREAVRLYLAQTKAGGLIALHLSNKFIDLPPVAAALAAAEQLDAKLVDDRPAKGSAGAPSLWVLLKRRSDAWHPSLAHLPDLTADGSLPPWTDRYSSLFPVLRHVSSAELVRLVQ